MRSFLYPYLKIVKKCPAIRCESRYSAHIQLKFLIQNSNLSVKDELFIKLPLLEKTLPYLQKCLVGSVCWSILRKTSFSVNLQIFSYQSLDNELIVLLYLSVSSCFHSCLRHISLASNLRLDAIETWAFFYFIQFSLLSFSYSSTIFYLLFQYPVGGVNIWVQPGI